MIDRMRELEAENARLRSRLPDVTFATPELVALEGEVNDRFAVPSGTIFAVTDRFSRRFSAAETQDLDVAVAGLVADRWPSLAKLVIATRWAVEGGQSTPAATNWVRTRLLSKELSHAFRADVLMTFGWDWFYGHAPTLWQVERMIDRQLRRIVVEETSKGLKIGLREPDFVAYLADVAEFGLWDTQGARALPSFQQMPIWDEPVGVLGGPVAVQVAMPQAEAAE